MPRQSRNSYLESYNYNKALKHASTVKAANDGDHRKTKTIFSMDTPQSRAQVNSGLGQGGDGIGVHPRESKVAVSPYIVDSGFGEGGYGVRAVHPRKSMVTTVSSTSSYFTKKEVQEQSASQKESKTKAVLGNESLLEIDNERSGKCPELKVGDDYIGILPDSELERDSSPEGSDVFILVLKRSSQESGQEFRRSMKIHNMTPFLHGYKICCNSSASFKLSVSPTIGLIRPNEQISFEIQTKEPMSTFRMKYDRTKDKVEMKIFRYGCSDPDKLEKYSAYLERKYPEQISTQPIGGIILWDTDDITEEMDEFEQYPLSPKTTPISSSSPAASTKQLLASVKNQFITTERNVQQTVEELSSIRKAQSFIVGLIFTCFLISMLHSIAYPHGYGVAYKAKPVPAGIWTRILKTFRLK